MGRNRQAPPEQGAGDHRGTERGTVSPRRSPQPRSASRPRRTGGPRAPRLPRCLARLPRGPVLPSWCGRALPVERRPSSPVPDAQSRRSKKKAKKDAEKETLLWLGLSTRRNLPKVPSSRRRRRPKARSTRRRTLVSTPGPPACTAPARLFSAPLPWQPDERSVSAPPPAHASRPAPRGSAHTPAPRWRGRPRSRALGEPSLRPHVERLLAPPRTQPSVPRRGAADSGVGDSGGHHTSRVLRKEENGRRALCVDHCDLGLSPRDGGGRGRGQLPPSGRMALSDARPPLPWNTPSRAQSGWAGVAVWPGHRLTNSERRSGGHSRGGDPSGGGFVTPSFSPLLLSRTHRPTHHSGRALVGFYTGWRGRRQEAKPPPLTLVSAIVKVDTASICCECSECDPSEILFVRPRRWLEGLAEGAKGRWKLFLWHYESNQKIEEEDIHSMNLLSTSKCQVWRRKCWGIALVTGSGFVAFPLPVLTLQTFEILRRMLKGFY
ncbi:putative uncharacterized protein FRMD6-AS1 [Mustela putorius furo]|uniref:Uncharacterized protein n=1 Tax=Mustela putorius furo TaxID=9669 RepID=A0A8U0UVT5_MUSPF|nr:putative uncharacterized protein FRMD6-AS1 [Mustela putorius furo]